MPEQAVVVELTEGLEPNILSLPHNLEDAVHLQSVGSVCGTVGVANILLKQLVLISVFVKGLEGGTSTMAQVSQCQTDRHMNTEQHS